MVVVVVHEPSSLFLGQGFVLVGRADALEFDTVQSAANFLARYASEPCYEVADLADVAA
jgi:hypothetical protein